MIRLREESLCESRGREKKEAKGGKKRGKGKGGRKKGENEGRTRRDETRSCECEDVARKRGIWRAVRRTRSDPFSN
jgi:hypothetical protein